MKRGVQTDPFNLAYTVPYKLFGTISRNFNFIFKYLDLKWPLQTIWIKAHAQRNMGIHIARHSGSFKCSFCRNMVVLHAVRTVQKWKKGFDKFTNCPRTFEEHCMLSHSKNKTPIPLYLYASFEIVFTLNSNLISFSIVVSNQILLLLSRSIYCRESFIWVITVSMVFIRLA